MSELDFIGFVLTILLFVILYVIGKFAEQVEAGHQKLAKQIEEIEDNLRENLKNIERSIDEVERAVEEVQREISNLASD